jgi:hypothetical protein
MEEREFNDDLEGSGRGLVEVISWNFLGATEESQEKFHSGSPMSQQRFDPITSQIRVKSVIATSTRLLVGTDAS